MKLRRTLRFHSLRKGKVRMTWNKYNLYNLDNVQRKIPNFVRRTFFQQKWSAKAMTRAYHGEHIKEQKWTRMFDRRLRSVVDMNPQYMAINDGAEQATGRGSGRDIVTREDVTPWRERELEAEERAKAKQLAEEEKLELELMEARMEGREEEVLREREEKQKRRDEKLLIALTKPGAEGVVVTEKPPNYKREFLPVGGWKMREIFQAPADMHEVDVAVEEEETQSKTQAGHNSQMGNAMHGTPNTRAAHNTQMGAVGRTPYMNMSYAPIERRIDVAIFRAMFASSTRQARNLVIHGKVKVNGQPMNHATYLLNPGDMFQVEPEAVMFATGKIKTKAPPPAGPKKQRTGQRRKSAKAARGDATDEAAAAEADEGSSEPAEADEGPLEPAESAGQALANANPEEVQERLRTLASETRKYLNAAIKSAKVTVADDENIGAKRKKRLRVFLATAKSLSSQLGRKDGKGAITNDITNDVMASINEAFQGLLVQKDGEDSEDLHDDEIDVVRKDKSVKKEKKERKKPKYRRPAWTDEGDDDHEDTSATELSTLDEDDELDEEHQMYLQRQIEEYEENPFDKSKPYHTPWEPRPFMNAFAFIPRYLEVNQNICAAVYLRHPVARQGMAEIPSPFPPSVQELAFNWYLRRR